MNYSKSSQISSQISPYQVSPSLFYVNTIKKFYFLKNIKKKIKEKIKKKKHFLKKILFEIYSITLTFTAISSNMFKLTRRIITYSSTEHTVNTTFRVVETE